MSLGRIAPAIIGLLTVACEDDVRATLDLDRIVEPTDCVEVVHERLELGDELHEYLADAPHSAGGWALISVTDDFDPPTLALVRVPATPDEPETEPIEVGHWSPGSVHFELRSGAAPGELWVLRDAGSAVSLYKLHPGEGVVAYNAYPTNDGGGGCPNYFSRQLLLLDEHPFVLALPSCSSSTALETQLFGFDPDSLLLDNGWLLTFDACASDPLCGLDGYPYTLSSIRGGESTRAADAQRIELGFTQVRNLEVGLVSADVSLLELWLVAGTPEARLVTLTGVWQVPTHLGLVHLAQDPFSTQLHVRNGNNLDAALIRFDLAKKSIIRITSPQLLPLGGRGRLVQLGHQSAMIDVHGGALEVVPLVDVEMWPRWEPRILLEHDDLLDFEPAGVGQLLLRREQAPPQIVRLRCLG